MAAPTQGQGPNLDQHMRSLILGNAKSSGSKNAVTNQSDGLEAGQNPTSRRRSRGKGWQQNPPQTGNAQQVHLEHSSRPGAPHLQGFATRGNSRGGRGAPQQQVQILSRPDGNWRNQAINGNDNLPNYPGVGVGRGARGGRVATVPAHSHAHGRRIDSTPSAYAPLQRPQHNFAQMMDRQCDYLESLLNQEIPSMDMPTQEIAEKDAFRAYVEARCRAAAREAYGDGFPLQLEAFGSYASTFGMPGSDMDLALLVNEVPDNLPRLLERTLLDLGFGARLLTRTRVPIIKICEKPTSELYAALCDERAKWDKMSPEEREVHDQGSQRDDGKEKKDGTEKKQGKRSSQQVSSEESEAVLTDVASNTIEEVSNQPDSTAIEADAMSNPNPVDEVASHNKAEQATNVVSQPYGDEKTSIPTPDPAQPSQTPRNDAATQEPKAGPTNRPKQKVWLREKPASALDFPKSPPNIVGIQADINFSTLLGIHNTALLRCYSASDPRVRPFILFIKRWASRRKINSSYNGTVSSYGFVLMALHVLVNVARPPVCPNLQLTATHQVPDHAPPNSARMYYPPSPTDPSEIADGCDIRFWRNEPELRNLSSKGLLTHNRQPLGALLRLFFLYYGSQGPRAPSGGFLWTSEVLSLRTPGGILSKQAKGWTGARTTAQREDGGGAQVRHRYLFAVEDPFEWEHNVGRTVTHFGIVAVRDEFRRAGRVLEAVGREGVEGHEGGVLDALVEAGKEGAVDLVADGKDVAGGKETMNAGADVGADVSAVGSESVEGARASGEDTTVEKLEAST